MQTQILEATNFKSLLPGRETWISLGQSLLYTAVQLVVLWLFYFLLRQALKRLMHRWFSPRKAETLFSVSGSFLRYVSYFIAASLVLYNVFGISLSSIIAVAGVGGIAIGFGAQSLVRDVLTGMFILGEDQYGIGDNIEVCGKSGTVKSIGLRITRIRDINGDLHVIPNGEIKLVTNRSRDYSRAIVDIGIPAYEEANRVLEIFNDEMAQYEPAPPVRGKPIVQGITRFEANRMVIRIVCDCTPGQGASLERELLLRIKSRLDRENISM